VDTETPEIGYLQCCETYNDSRASMSDTQFLHERMIMYTANKHL